MKKYIVMYPGKTFFTSNGYKLRRWTVNADGSVSEIAKENFDMDFDDE